MSNLRIHPKVVEIIEKHAKEAGKSMKEFCIGGLKDMLGDQEGQRLVDILEIGGGCPIEAYTGLMTESLARTD